MDVVDRRMDRCRLEQVVVMSGAGLPETMVCSVSMLDRQALKEIRRLAIQIRDRFPAHWPFDRGENLLHFVERRSGEQQQVDVFGHDHPRPEVEGVVDA